MNIKKITGGVFIINLFFVFASFQSAAAQTGDARRIEFDPRQTSKVVHGKMKRADLIHDYSVSARAGQTMSVSLISKNRAAYFSIICPGCLQIGDTPFGMKDAYQTHRWTGAIPDTGGYTIRIGTDKPAAFGYTLKVSVRSQNLTAENPQLIKQITGNYAARNGSDLDAQLLANGNLKFHLTAVWKSPTNRGVIHVGEIHAVLPMKNNLAIYERGKCKIVLEFLPRKVNVLQTGSDANCDFGAYVNAAGTYRKINGRIPDFDF